MTEKYLAVDIGGTDIKWALMDHNLTMQNHGSQKDTARSVQELIDVIQHFREMLPDVSGIGISVPGTVRMDDPDGTVLGGGVLTYLDKVPLGKLVRERCGVPVAVLNDGKCGVLGEYEAGVLKGSRSGVVLALGTGVGGGVILDGKILEGYHSFAGEFSFLSTSMFQPFNMGNVIGGMCGWPALKQCILKEMNQEDSDDITGYTLFGWIEEGNEAAVRGLHAYAHRVAVLIFQLQAVVDPQYFVIAGGISARKELIQAIQEEVLKIRNAIPYGQIPYPEVKGALLGNDANLYGAAVHLKRNL